MLYSNSAIPCIERAESARPSTASDRLGRASRRFSILPLSGYDARIMIDQFAALRRTPS